jgi:hypothetical protein
LFSACLGTTDTGGTNSVPAKFRFQDGAGSSSRSNMGSRSVQGGVLRAVTRDETSFEPYYAAYDRLGEKVASITPTEFYLSVMELVLCGDNGRLMTTLISASPYTEAGKTQRQFNFTEPVTITLGDVATGYYDLLYFRLTGQRGPFSEDEDKGITFDWPADMNHGTWVSSQRDGISSGAYDGVFTAADNTYSTLAANLDIYHVDPNFGSNPDIGQFIALLFAGNVTKMALDDLRVNDIFPDYDLKLSTFPEGYFIPLDTWNDKSVSRKSICVVPFEGGVTIPEGAGAVRFEINWDLDDLIERYDNDTMAGSNSNVNDDVFVFKKDWWTALSIQVFIE